jgi:hypothetical protein
VQVLGAEGGFAEGAGGQQFGAEDAGEQAGAEGRGEPFAVDAGGDVGAGGFGDLAAFVQEDRVVGVAAGVPGGGVDGAVGGLVAQERVLTVDANGGDADARQSRAGVQRRGLDA